jgi:hypothetical protein
MATKEYREKSEMAMGDEFADDILAYLNGTLGEEADDDEFEDDDEEEEDADEEDSADTSDGEEESGDSDEPGDSDGESDSGDDESDGEAEQGDEEQPEDKQEGEELAADGEPKLRGERANNRIRKLVDEKKEAQAALESLKEELAQAKAEAETARRQAVVTSEKHPKPDEEKAEVLKKLAEAPQAADVMGRDDVLNPLTGQPYTPVEAQLACLEYRQGLEKQLQSIDAAVVDNMTRANASKALFNEQAAPHINGLIERFPELDRENAKYNEATAGIFKAVIDANCVMERGLVTGFKKPPEKFIAEFEKLLTTSRAVRVNETKKVDKKVSNMKSNAPVRTAHNNAPDVSKSMEDALLAGFEEYQKGERR